VRVDRHDPIAHREDGFAVAHGLDRLDRYRVPDIGEAIHRRDAADPIEALRVVLNAGCAEDLVGGDFLGQQAERRAVFRRGIVQVIGAGQPLRARHVGNDDARVAGNVPADVPGNQPCIEIVSAAGRIADIDRDGLSGERPRLGVARVRPHGGERQGDQS